MARVLLIALAVLLVLFAILVGAGIYYALGTPYYSLYAVRNAMASGDRDEFYRHFDLQRVVAANLDRLKAQLPTALPTDALAGVVRPAVERAVTQKLDERIAAHDASAARDLEYESMRYEGEIAIVTMRKKSDGTETIVRLEPTPDRRWKIVDIDLAKANVNVSPLDVVPSLPGIPAIPRLPIPKLH